MSTAVVAIEDGLIAEDGACSRPDQLFGLWAMESRRFQQYFELAKGADLEALRKEARKLRKEAAASGIETPLYGRTPDGVARIDVVGSMTKYETSFQALFGGTSTLRARKAIRAAARDPEIVGIMLVFDSPGGTVSGTSDLADEISEANKRKPVYTYAEDLMASAALFAGVKGRKLYANKGAEIGSIGTYAVVHDQSGRYAQASVKVHVISSAPPHKGAGVSGSEISPSQLAEWERQVTDIAELFVSEVAAGRGLSKEEADALHTGQVWSAADAKAKGLIDDVISLDEAMRRLRSEAMNEKELTDAKTKAEAAAKDAEAQAEKEKQGRAVAEKEAADLRARIEKLEGEQRRERFAREAQELGLPADFATHLDTIDGAVKPPVYAALVERFKALREQVKAGKAFSEIGTDRGDEGGDDAPSTKLQAIADGLVKEGKAKNKAEGLTLAAKQHPDLYKAHVDAQRRK